jgi:hypothetical protein
MISILFAGAPEFTSKTRQLGEALLCVLKLGFILFHGQAAFQGVDPEANQ